MTRSAWGFVVLAAALGLAAMVGVVRCEGSAPRIDAPQQIVVGREGGTLAVEAADEGAGLRQISAVLVHAGGETPLGERAIAGGRWLPFGSSSGPLRVELAIDPKGLGLREGKATLRVRARDHAWRGWLAGNEAAIDVPVQLDFSAPRLSVAPGITYSRRGGAGVLVYQLGEETARDGVEVGERFFPGLRPGGGDDGGRAAGSRFALFALPIDAPEAQPAVVAWDAADNRTRVVPAVRIQERRIAEALLPLSPAFLDQKVGELAAAVDVDPSDRIRAFQEINTRVRAENEKRVREIAAQSAPEPLFQGAFEQLANSKVTSPFAERRSYVSGGRKISESVHYGYDLASLAGSPVTAANRGRVLFADELGIYGHCVVLDHGVGLVSLYGHLSSVDVEAGDVVEKGQVIGRSGQTGLAGGDHLHFAMMLHGVYVDPVEWWDAKWVREHVEEPLAAAGR
jgi:murein DD-endopeptidase MepM/ murein hydrolase activator NlpD